MEQLKALASIAEPDVRHRHFPAVKLEDTHREMARLELSPSVPEDVASAFAVARNIWLLGWFHWPLYTTANLHAFLCLEAALNVRARAAGLFKGVYARRRSPMLAKLLQKAVGDRCRSR